jgi:hypothetical protein
MDGLLEVLVVAGVFFLLSALGGGKRKQQARPRPDARRPQVPARPRPQTPAPRGRTDRVPGPPAARGEPASLTDALFAILRGEVPETAAPPPRGEFIPEGPEAVSLETLEPAGEASHERFEAKYVDHPATFEVQGARRVRRLHVTPRAARDAVVWTAILSKPKGLQ